MQVIPHECFHSSSVKHIQSESCPCRNIKKVLESVLFKFSSPDHYLGQFQFIFRPDKPKTEKSLEPLFSITTTSAEHLIHTPNVKENNKLEQTI